MDSPAILSTKKLSLSQKELLLHAGFRLVEYNAIEIDYLDFEAPKKIENAIFTSQHGVQSYLQKKSFLSPIKSCYCVGEKTASHLAENGQNVIKIAQNSKELANYLLEKSQNCTFYYFCGSRRRHELPNILKSKNIPVFELKTYKTTLKPKLFKQNWAGILFFSPSGVQSFMLKNSFKDETVCCIGETTAQEARKHTKNVVVATSTTIESVIAKAAKTLKTVKT